MDLQYIYIHIYCTTIVLSHMFIIYDYHYPISLYTTKHSPKKTAPGNLVGKDFTTVRRLYGCLGERDELNVWMSSCYMLVLEAPL